MNQVRNEREKRMLADFPKGAIVRVKDPDAYIAAVANKVRDRLGEVTGHQIPAPNPIVTFHAIGRKKRYQQVFNAPDRDLEIVTDLEAISTWCAEIEASKARSAKRRETAQA